MQELNLSKGDSVYYLERLRYVDGNVLCIEYSYYNKEIVKYLNTEITEGSIFDYFRTNMQVKVGFSDIYFNADQLNTNEAQLLKLEPNDPCLRYTKLLHTTGITIRRIRYCFPLQKCPFLYTEQKIEMP
nr:GntR family transcriptional regulator [Staphylococcus pseudintermedius]